MRPGCMPNMAALLACDFSRPAAAERGDQAPVDGACRRAGQLLAQDRADQSLEVSLRRRVHLGRTGLGDEPAQDGITLGQDFGGRLVAAGRAGGYCRTGHVKSTLSLTAVSL